MSQLLREFVRRVLLEQGGERLAVVIVGDDGEDDILGLGSMLGGGEKMAVLYDASKFVSEGDDGEDLYSALKGAVRGMVQIGRPMNKCLGAWEVQQSAGQGYGKQLYTIAGALSPKHLLVPDRSQVSGPAKAAWEKQGQRKRYELDNVGLPQAKRRTPDDPNDDCAFHDEDHLNFAYDYSGEGQQLVSQLSATHEEAVQVLVKKYQVDTDDLQAAFKRVAKEFFASKRAAVGFSI